MTGMVLVESRTLNIDPSLSVDANVDVDANRIVKRQVLGTVQSLLKNGLACFLYIWLLIDHFCIYFQMISSGNKKIDPSLSVDANVDVGARS